MKGKVVWYNISRGYGFIQGNDKKKVFIHKGEVPFWTIYLKKGDLLNYNIEETSKGLKAIDVSII